MGTKGTSDDKLALGEPMMWQEPKDQCTYCYFYFVKTSGFNKKNQCKIEYPNLPLAKYSMIHSAKILLPVLMQQPSFENLNHNEFSDNNHEDFEIEDDLACKECDQYELNALTQDLGLSKRFHNS